MAVGRMGLSVDDFRMMTLPQFRKAYDMWAEDRELSMRLPYEVMRLQVCMTLQPFVKGKLVPSEILPLPWDSHPVAEESMHIPTREEALARFQQLRSLEEEI